MFKRETLSSARQSPGPGRLARFSLLAVLAMGWSVAPVLGATVTFVQQDANYPTQFNDGGDFFNGAAELGMWANSGNKNTAAWRTFKTAGDNTGSSRSLQVGDVFKITVSATRAFGQIGFSLNASGTQGSSYANRTSGSRMYANTDNYGAWYVNRSGGTTSLSYSPIQSTYKDYIFTIRITSETTADVFLTVDGTDYRAYNLTLNGSAGANIDAFSTYGSDMWDGDSNDNAYWKQTATVENTGQVQLGYYLASGTFNPGRITDGLVATSTSSSSANAVAVGGDSGSAVILDDNNTFTGASTVNAAATARAQHANAFGTTAGGVTVTSGGKIEISGTITVGSEALTLNGSGISSSGALQNTGNNNEWQGAITLGSSTRINSDSGTLTLSGGITGNTIGLTVGGSGATVINSVIGTTSGTLTKDGSGTLTLSGANTYNGTTTVSTGTLQLGSGGTSGSSAFSTYSLASGATLLFNRSDSPTCTNAITFSGGSTHPNVSVASSCTATLTGPITTSGAEFWVNDAGNGGTLVVNRVANSFNAAVVIVNGVLETADLSNSGGSSSLGVGGIYIAQGGSGTLRYTGGTATTDRIGAAALQGTGYASTIDISSGSATLTISSAVGDSPAGRGLTKSGSGALKLSNTCTYSGATSVSAGELIVSGSIGSSDVTVASGAVLRGAGSVKSITASGRVSPGNTSATTGQLTCNSAMTLNGGGSMTCKITNWTSPAAGTDFNQVKVGATGAGTVTLNNDSGNRFTLYVDSNGVTPTGWNDLTELSWIIIDAGTIGGPFDAAKFTVDVNGFFPSETGTFAVETDGSGNIVLHYTPPVPTITLSSGAALDFGSTNVNSTSSEQSYTVSGAYLTADIVVTAPSGFEVSTTSGSGFGGSVTLTQSVGTVASTTIYARFKPTTEGSYSANIAHTSLGATTRSKPVTGTGTPPLDPAAFSVTGGTNLTTLAFTRSADLKPVVIVRNTSGSFSSPSGTPTLLGSLAGGTVAYIGSTSPQTDGSLLDGQVYYYKAFSYDSVGDFYSPGLTANATTAPPAPVASLATATNHVTFTAAWSAATAATGYWLDVATDSGFTSTVSGYHNLSLGNVTSSSVTVPVVGEYVYRVRAGNAAGFSPNSSTITVDTTQAQGRNKNGGSPYVNPSTVFLGDTVTFGADLWATINGTQGRARAVVNGTATVGAGRYGPWGSVDGTEYTEASLQATNPGTLYWGIQMDYGSYGTNFWYTRDNSAWTDLYYNGTNGNLTVTVNALPDPTAVVAVTNTVRPDTKVDLSWAPAGGYQVMVVRRAGGPPDTPVNGTAYALNATYGAGGRSVVVVAAGAGTAMTNTGLSASTAYTYAFFSENYNYYSTGAVASVTTSAAAPGNLGVAPATLTFTTTLGSTPAVQTMVVTNSGGSSMTYSNLVIAGTGGNWLSVTPTNGTLAVDAGTTHTAAVALVAAAGVYTATNWVNGDQGNAAQAVAVTYTVNAVPTPTGVSLSAIGTRQLNVNWTLGGYPALIVRREGGNPDPPTNGTSYSAGNTYGPDARNTVVANMSGTFTTDTGVYPQTAYSYGVFGNNNDYYSPGAFASGTTLTASVDGNAEEWVGTAGTVVNASTTSRKEFIWRDKSGEQRNDSVSPPDTDIEEFRVRADATDLYFYVKLQSISLVARPYIAVGVDIDRNPSDPNGLNTVGDDADTGLGDGYYVTGNAQMRYPERNVIVHNINTVGHRVEVYRDDGSSWSTPATSAANFNGTFGFIEFRVARSDLGLTGSITGRLTVASFFNADIWANDGDSTANYSGTDAQDSLGVLPYGYNDGAGSYGTFGEDLSDNDIDGYMDIKLGPSGLVDNVVPDMPDVTNVLAAVAFPPNNAVIEQGPFGFHWGGVTDTDDTVTSYLIEVSTNASFNGAGGENYAIATRVNVQATTNSYSVDPAPAETQFWWRVRSRDLGGALSGFTNQTFRIAGADDDTTGPQATIVYVGPSYTQGMTSVSLTDADMLNTGELVDIAVMWSDPSGVFMTNGPGYANNNIIDNNGRVIPNWDLLTSNTLTGATAPGEYDLPFNEFIGNNGAGSVTSVYHNAFSVLSISTNTAFFLTASAEDEDNDRSTKPDPQNDGDPVPFDRTITTNQLVQFTVVDDDTNGPTYTAFNVNGAVFTNTDLAAGLVVTGLVQDVGSGIYGSDSNRYTLYWYDLPVASGVFTTRPATDGAAKAAPEAMGVTLDPISVTVTGVYTLVCSGRDYDRESALDSLAGSGAFTFQVAQPPLPPGNAGTYFVMGSDWSSATALPFTEVFDALGTGPLNGANGWQASASSVAVQSATAISGKAAAVANGYAFRGFSATGATNVWMDWYARPVPRTAVPVAIRDIPLKSAAAFYLNGAGQVVALSNGTWVTYATVTLATNDWSRFSVNLDYVNARWSLYAGGSTADALLTSVFRNAAFFSNVASPALSLRLAGDGAAAGYVDAIGVAASMPMTVDDDGDRMADAWENAYLGGTGTGAAADSDGDGVDNRREYLAGTHPQNPSSYLRVVQMDLSSETSSDVRVSWVGGEWNGPTTFSSSGDSVSRSYRLLAADNSNSAPYTVRGSVSDGLTGTNAWVDTNAANLYTARYYQLAVQRGLDSYTNTEEWAMYVQPRASASRYFICVPVNYGSNSANNVNAALGHHLARGLHGDGSDQYTNNADYVEYQNAQKQWTRLYLVTNQTGAVYWWNDDSPAGAADLVVAPGTGLWVQRRTGAVARANTVFTGKSFLDSDMPTLSFTTSDGGWTAFGWPLPTPLHNVNQGTSTPAAQLGFEAQASGGTDDRPSAPAYLRGDRIWLWGNNEWDTRYWLMDHFSNTTRNLRWWSNRDNDYADFTLRPGQAYFYLHVTNQWGGATFPWTPQSP